jgi:hypothetical protein
MHEASLHEHNHFLTLTYSDDELPSDGSLDYSHFQQFMKNIRKRNSGIRFYMCGEYGELNNRPHYHAILFNLHLPDACYYSRSSTGEKIYTSAIIDRAWGRGFCPFGAVTFQSAAYVARYVMKKQTGASSYAHYTDTSTGVIRVPEFNHMSLKPGIGRGWFDKYFKDVYPHDRVILNGAKMKPPKYYDRVYTQLNGTAFEELQFLREKKFRESSAYTDTSPERLNDKEVVTLARMKFLKRG